MWSRGSASTASWQIAGPKPTEETHLSRTRNPIPSQPQLIRHIVRSAAVVPLGSAPIEAPTRAHVAASTQSHRKLSPFIRADHESIVALRESIDNARSAAQSITYV